MSENGGVRKESGGKPFVIGLVGNPNCGKTTIFNALTGAKQHIGNWPGVTVEKKEGMFTLPSGVEAKLVDLPGIYSLTAVSEDERASLEYLLSHEADIYVNVVDATTIERNFYLTLLLCEMRAPMIIVLTMMDIARQRRIVIDLEHLQAHLGVPVIGVNATSPLDVRKLLGLIDENRANARVPNVGIEYPDELEREIDILSSATVKTAQALGVERRWVAIKALEGDPLIRKLLDGYRDMAPEVIDSSVERCSSVLKESPDVILADTRYGVIAGLCRDVVRIEQEKTYLSEKIDRFVINRFLGIPLFLCIMHVVFWLTQTVGGALIDFFDILGGAVFVDCSRALLAALHSPEWLVALVSGGVGVGLQTVSTFIPPIFFMFLCLSILEDSGYMARAAFLMDRFMRWIGLPGKSFVPMLVGFGCTVPAIMATRALDSKRDRFLTIFMTPFMSCGAKLPVYVAFGAAFFAPNPGRMVFWLYASGIILGVATGLLMKRTLFQGQPSHFIMELPPYHVPRVKHILLHTWERLKMFIFRAGKVIVLMTLLLGFLNSMGRDGSFGNENSRDSVLSAAGQKLTPVFVPMGVEPENWPATVSLFTGLFAKEAVIGTMNSLYGQNAAAIADQRSAAEATTGASPPAVTGASAIPGDAQPAAAPQDGQVKRFTILPQVKAAFASVPRNLRAAILNVRDPVGLGAISSDESVAAGVAGMDESVFAEMRKHFPKGRHQAFAFLLFVLLYVPCIAATGVAFRELGKWYGSLFVTYLTVLGWCVATLYFQLALGGQALWIAVPVLVLLAMFGSFWAIGRKHKVDMM